VTFERHSNSRVGLWYNHPSNGKPAVDLRTAAEEKHTLKRIIITLLTLLLLAPSTVFSQTRSRSSSRQKPAATTATQRVAQVRTQGATRVADQIKTLSRFMYVLGGVTSSLAAVEDAARRSGASAADQSAETKAKVRATIQNIKDGLDKLEVDFRATPELQPYYIKLAGVAAGAAAAEEQASASQFDAAGRQLLNVVNRLTDVLLLMRTTE
jgi:GTP1/Obg family GTP-binding protein